MSERSFAAPGPGTWELETTHLSKPVTAYTSAVFPDGLMRGFKEGTERYGLLLSHLKPVFIHGFCYMKAVPAFVPEDAPSGPPPEGFFEQPELVSRIERGQQAIENKLWREDLKRWDDEVKPDSIRRNMELQAVDPGGLNTEELIGHLQDCFDNVKEMWYRHHLFSIPSILPTGLYMGNVCQWTGAPPGEVLGLLKGSSPVSRGLAINELAHVADLLRQAGVEPGQFEDQPAKEVLQALRTRPAPIGSAIERYLDIVGYQITSGYDITERYALETPEILVANIWSALSASAAGDSDSEYEQAYQSIRGKVPDEHRAEFDALLQEARLINRLRDERGVYNEARAFGISRRAILEAGNRLVRQQRLSNPSLLLQASHEEMLAILRGADEPTESELQQRDDWYQENNTDNAAPFLGQEPEGPPPLDALPEAAREAEAAIGAALGNIFEAVLDEKPEGVVVGLAVSPGVYVGTARLISNPSDFQRLQQGDILVTKNTSATFNVVLPMLGAIVTDRGGQLSHAAIVAREYGIPCIVGTRNATKIIPDGGTVRIDGTAGTLEIRS
jgi:pyruvate,water dikinase